MKQLNDLTLAGLASGLSKVLSDEIGGEFDVTVQKVERTNPQFSNDKLLLSFVVTDASSHQRYRTSKEGQWLYGEGGLFGPREVSMTAEQFKERAVRTATDTVVTYDVRPLQTEQQQGVAVFLGELVFKLGLNALPISKPLVLLTDDNFVNTEQLDGFITKLGEAGLAVTIQKEAPTP